MSFRIAKPSAILSPLIKQYWSIETELSAGDTHKQRIIPSGLPELSFYLGDKPEVLSQEMDFTEKTIFSGQLEGFYDISVSGKLSLFSISFQPHGAMMFFDTPMDSFYNRNVPMKYFLKDKLSSLESMLSETGSFEERVRLAEEFLIAQLKRYHKLYSFRRISASINLINVTGGKASIENLAAECCLSRKQFERSFLEFVGDSPKNFLRTVRFQHSLHLRNTNNELSMGDLAFLCGYFDQSHMINEYKKISGLTPGQYFLECEPFSDYFQ
jgi:AraC-like DNA-binding protein